MDSESMAEIMEETTLTKIRLKLNEQKVKLWEPPYYDKEQKSGNEENMQELALTLKAELSLPMGHLIQGLLTLQQNALEKLEARKRYEESGVLYLRLKCSKGLKSRIRIVEIDSQQTGKDLQNKIGGLVDKNPGMLKIICNGRVVQDSVTLKDQGLKTSSTVMAVLVSSVSQLQQQVVDEQRRILLDQTKKDAERLGNLDADKDDFALQIADQTGRALNLPKEEHKALIIAMSLHEKGREALAKNDYPSALVFNLEAEQEFSNCRSELVEKVDNFAILNLDIVWCYLMLQAVNEIPNAGARLENCERMFKESYGSNLERLHTIKGSTGQEAALLMRLHLLQGIVAFHLGREREATLLLQKTRVESELLEVNEQLLFQLVDMGYSVGESRLGLRAAQGNLEAAVNHINNRREEREDIRKKEAEERELRKKRESAGKCADGSWVNLGYLDTLIRMGFPRKVAIAALKQSNNGLNLAVQLLQEEPDLIQLAVDESDEVKEEDIARLVSLGYSPEVSRKALEKEGNVEDAADYLFENKGNVPENEGEREQKRRRTQEKAEDKASYERIKTAVDHSEEDHLDTDLKLEKDFLDKYCQLLNINKQ
eukprot:TRINITY_DN4212_c1_g1_i3.p1 TRINITY_DN4212_c1_g1~~TRINITY_DN4212_c1_g1_i3.p1  ORF type:complete len:599 (-),score=158.24 TRINITY_DN4212_c1_g1_i3:71-1867(-)